MDDEVFTRFRSARERTQNIKDYSVFSLNYIPPKIFLRDQAREIIDQIGDHIEKGVGEHLLVTGLRGTGKTLTVKWALNKAADYIRQEKIDMFLPCYVSARELDTYSLLLSLVTQLLGEEGEKIRRGIPTGNLIAILKDLLSKKRAIVAIDEIEFLKNLNILYTLSRDTQAMIIVIGTKSLWREQDLEDDSVKSSFSPRNIHFDPYSPDEIAEILRQRAELGLYHYDHAGISYLASAVALNYNSDVRYGILALKSLGKWDRWSPQDVDRALTTSVRDLEYSLLRSLSNEKLGLLYTITQHHDGIRTAELYQIFFRKTHLSKTTFFSYIDELEKLGLIYAGGGKKGRAYLVAPIIKHPELVKEVAQDRGILEGSKLSDYLI
jgi:Cdc6-like AAA superfamily ATPase